MRRKAAKLQRIDEILARALKKRHVPFRSEDRRLIDLWEKAVGPQIAAQSRPEAIRKETLCVKVSNSVWMHQLHFLKEEIIGKVKDLMPGITIKEIRFSIGQLPLPVEEEKFTSTPPITTGHLKERDKRMIETCLASLADEELQVIVKRLMIKEITFRRSLERKAP